MAKPIPDGYHTLTPVLSIRGAAQAIDFYKRAFGAEELFRMAAPDGRVGHAELKVGDSRVMLGEEEPQRGCVAPTTLKGTPVSFYLYVPDADAAFQRATQAGCKVRMPVTDMFWGDRYGEVEDPFGHRWGLATHKEDLSDDEIRKRAQAFHAQAAKA